MNGSELIQEELAIERSEGLAIERSEGTVELFTTEIIRPEVNFLLLPFFALSWKEIKKLTKIEYQASVKRKGAEAEISWTVLPSTEYGIPTPFDKELKGIVDAIISQTQKPISNPLELPYISEMARMVGLKPDKRGFYRGQVYKMIKGAFLRMVATTVHSKGTFYIKGKKIWAEKAFHLYDTVIFRGETLSDGTVAEKNYLWLNELYLDSINSNYVKPIDYTYFQSLKNYIAKRLYEFLGVKFYGLRNKREQFFRIGYLNLCQLLPITKQKSLKRARQILNPPHNELIQTGFLAKVEYEDTKDRKSFNILYFPGERARKEVKGDWGLALEQSEGLEIVELDEGLPDNSEFGRRNSEFPQQLHLQPDYPKAVGKEMSPIAQELFNRGIVKSAAIDFAESFSEEYILEKIEMHDYKRETGELTTNTAGWLREAIVHDYKPTEQQLKKQAKLLEEKARQEEQRTFEEKAREIQEQRLKESLLSFPSSEQWVRERVMEHVNVREMTIKSIGGEQFTQEEIAEMYLKYKAQVPKTEEEKRGWLISNYSKYSLSSIIEELRVERSAKRR